MGYIGLDCKPCEDSDATLIRRYVMHYRIGSALHVSCNTLAMRPKADLGR